MLKKLERISYKYLPSKIYSEIYLFFYKILFFKIKLLYRLETLNLETLLKYKKNEKLFILGSGGSINDIKNWKEIRKNDSIGFNFWLYHEFVPNFFCFENSQIEERNEKFYKIFKLKKSFYNNSLIFIKDLEISGISRSKLKLFNKLYCINAIEIPGDTIEEIFKIMDNKEFYKKKSTLSLIIDIAIKMEYKEIIFCGIDLNNNSYFYENEKYKKYDIPFVDKSSSVHLTNNKKISKITIFDYIKEIKNKNKNIKFYTLSSKSELAKILEVYNFEN